MQISLPNKVFITGTDTEIGKTYIAAHLLRSAREKGLIVEGIKPLVSGGMQDIEILHAASSQSISKEERFYASFEQPIAPHIAALSQGVKLQPASIISYMQTNYPADLIVIEGFGGWLAPINETITMAECVKSANIPVVLVVGLKLGCINHSLLSANNIKSMGCNLLGWIANVIPPKMQECERNIDTITSFLGAPLLIV